MTISQNTLTISHKINIIQTVIALKGINLDKDINYLHSSLRFFNKNEYHVSRVCKDDVLLLVYEGVLRFTEDGKKYEIGAGEYHIQRHGSVQTGWKPSDSPKYFYVHFMADWGEGDSILPKNGVFEYSQLRYIIEEMDALARGNKPYILKTGKFYELLSRLYRVRAADGIARKVADYLEKEYRKSISLEMLCERFNYSKNHIINTFKNEFDVTPITYLNNVRLKNAEYMIEATSKAIEGIAIVCGYSSYSHFYRQFVRRNGVSPEKWREQRRIGRT